MESDAPSLFPDGEFTNEATVLALAGAPFAMVITNPRLEDNPIVYVNRAFERTTGYLAEACVGRNCRFLQGSGTDPAAVARLRAAIAERREETVDILNYRADGRPFWNRLMVAPLGLSEEAGPEAQPDFFLGVQMAVRSPRFDEAAPVEDILAEIQHRVKNHLAMVVGMIRLQAREEPEADYETLARRIESLHLLYEELSNPAAGAPAARESVALGAYLGRISKAISRIDGRSGVRAEVEAEAAEVSIETAVRIGLIASEVLTNAMQHAFEGRSEGRVTTRLSALGDGGLRIEIADDGIGMPPGSPWPDNGNLGARIVRGLVQGIGARMTVAPGSVGTVVSIDVPAAQLD